MYKLLIVEDEKIERESLYSIIQSFDLPIQSIFTAENGQDGLQKYFQYHPDVILADINMPLLGGLDMIEEIRKHDVDVMCLVLTSYDYFSYAQKAIKLGVEEFILKPADKETLRKGLTLVVEKMMKNTNTYTQTSSLVQRMTDMKRLLESECFHAVLTKQNELKLLETFQMANIVATSCFCLVFQSHDEVIKKWESLCKEIEDLGYIVVSGNINHQRIMFIMSNRVLTNMDQLVVLDVIRHNQLEQYEFALGKIENECTQFCQSYEDAKHNINSKTKFFVNTTLEDTQKEYIKFAMDYCHKILNCTLDDAQEMVACLCNDFLKYEYKEINEILSILQSLLIKEANRIYSLELNSQEISFLNLDYDNYQNIEIVVTQVISKLLKLIHSMKYTNSSVLIKKAMQSIEKNYAKPMSLNTLAEELNVSPFYISKLFSKELQRNFTDVVNDVRINEAKRLVRNDFSLKEVAYKVGFGSQSYFTKIFKKLVGLSPKEYRKLFP